MYNLLECQNDNMHAGAGVLTFSAVAVSANSTKTEPLKSLLLRCRRNLTLFT